MSLSPLERKAIEQRLATLESQLERLRQDENRAQVAPQLHMLESELALRKKQLERGRA
jgi:ABC-type phosphate transport system auxiliary subunit